MGVYRWKGEGEMGTDRVGFEPTNGLPRYTLSRRVPSAARPPIHNLKPESQTAIIKPAPSLSPRAHPLNPRDTPTRIT